jgi:hypothetical protein
MNERQVAALLGKMLKQQDFAWSSISTDAPDVPCAIRVRTKADEDGSAATYRITVTREDELEGEEPQSKGKIWELKNPQHAHSGFVMEATIRSKFRDDGEGYVVYAAPSSGTMRVCLAIDFTSRYQLKPKYVTGGLYWSKSDKAFCLYQGTDKTVVKLLAAKTDAGTGAVTTSGEMPKDAVLVRYCEGSQFTLTHHIQAPRAS